MRIADALARTRRLFIDTAPVIYHVERHPRYWDLTTGFFRALRDGIVQGVTSPITLAECLVHPYHSGDTALADRFRRAISGDRGIEYRGIDAVVERAAQMRARYNLALTDAFQIAAALAAGCDAILTNDLGMRRVTELTVLVLDNLEP